jgi:hypothetical protein
VRRLKFLPARRAPARLQVQRKAVRASLTEPGAAQLALDCLKMATVLTDVDLPQCSASMAAEHWRLMAVGEDDAAAAVREFEQLEFKSLMTPLQAHLARLAARPS